MNNNVALAKVAFAQVARLVKLASETDDVEEAIEFASDATTGLNVALHLLYGRANVAKVLSQEFLNSTTDEEFNNALIDAGFVS